MSEENDPPAVTVLEAIKKKRDPLPKLDAVVLTRNPNGLVALQVIGPKCHPISIFNFLAGKRRFFNFGAKKI
jgi:hypothetical protein